MTQEANKKNKEVEKIFERLKTKYTLEEIAESFIFPVFRSDEEQKLFDFETSKLIREYKNNSTK